MSLAFPANLIPRSERWVLRGVTISGGISVGGVAGLDRTDGGGLWVCEQEFLLTTNPQIKAAAAFDASMDSGSRSVNLPVRVEKTTPGLGPHVYAVDEAAALRATTIKLKNYGSLTLQALSGGEDFTLVHPTLGPRKYRVASVVSTAGAVHTVTIRPPLREAAAINLNADFDGVSCIMRLANPDDFVGPSDPGPTVTLKALWVESFDAS